MTLMNPGRSAKIGPPQAERSTALCRAFAQVALVLGTRCPEPASDTRVIISAYRISATRAGSQLSCFPSGSGIACKQEVMLVYPRVNEFKIQDSACSGPRRRLAARPSRGSIWQHFLVGG